MKCILPLSVIFTMTLSFTMACGFVVVPSRKSLMSTEISMASRMLADIEVIDELKAQIQNEISQTQRGLSATEKQAGNVDDLIKKLEMNCPLSEPARSTLMGGKWIVDYTTAPPPSNGKLGPFIGYARQIIDLDEGTYVNYLSVPGDIEKEWLSAKLEATFSEWDGNFLESEEGVVQNNDEIDEGSVGGRREEKDAIVKQDFFASIQSMISGKSKSTEVTTPDYGAYSWKVNFQTLTIRLFGIPLITKKFENTSRVWKMSYLDEETRVVRAGRTGKDEDNMVFYMSRE